MATPKPERLVLDPAVPARLAAQVAGLAGWFREYAQENLPDEELAPGEDGLPADSQPELDEVKRVDEVEVYEVTDIGRGHLSLRCRVRLVIRVRLNDPDDTVVTVRPTWPVYLLVEPGTRSVLQHSHGWEGGWLPDPDPA